MRAVALRVVPGVFADGAPRRRVGLGAVLLAVSAALVVPGPSPDASLKVDPGLLRAAASLPGRTLQVVLRETDPAADVAERLVRHLGGRVLRDLSIIGGFSARLPASSLSALAGSPAVARVWGDGRVQFAGHMGQFDTWPPNTVWRAVVRLPQALGRTDGAGVTVAVLDTGLSPVADIDDGRVLARVDFTPERDGLDRYGHGTHMAGVVGAAGTYLGSAPGVNLVSVKVAGWDGATDVSVVMAGLQWIVANRVRYGIRVVNLSFGTDSTQGYSIDPLNFAVEQVWFSGVFVVVSAGNRGPGPGTVSKPGDDPFVLTVGAADLAQTLPVNDDAVASFSSRGPTADGLAKPDLVAPGISLVAPRAPGSVIEHFHQAAWVGDSYIKGSGSSQAAAVVSGIAALLFAVDPTLTPDVAKAILVGTANRWLSRQAGGGAGLVDAAEAVNAAFSRGAYRNAPANGGLVPSSGLGSLEASRGSFHVHADLDGDGVVEPVTGEVDVLGQLWDARAWSARSWSVDDWQASAWAGLVWDSATWDARAWSARSWSGMQWAPDPWLSNVWDARSWSTGGWDARSWSGSGWVARSWSARSWSSDLWN